MKRIKLRNLVFQVNLCVRTIPKNIMFPENRNRASSSITEIQTLTETLRYISSADKPSWND